ncbi:MAG TPA: extracellular solute-binding protein [Intrasporangium sp.]|uniref:ABC transporter substrate-binding protein n=1 Tax=Intrasporangium sp. TaxID=1925024 RepID=UPI002D792674|nr:extracellular solute-binding protein [Intrasporangium sp.]HET7397316.1 extracellular solute-binding protein [Intrasporangium sp.]
MPYPATSSRPSRRAVIGALGALTVGATAACSAPGPASGGTPAQGAAPTSVSTTLGSAPVTLKLYDGQGLKGVDDALIAAFSKKYPNVTITPTYDPDNVTTQNQPRQLASATPPDLVRVISVTAGTKNGLLTNLDAYATAYGWDKMPPSQLAQFRAKDGVAGSGSLYAKASGFTMTGLYYNKKLAQQVGMTTPPTSVEALTALMGKAKAAGLTGMVVANKEGGGVFPFQLLINSSMGPDKVSKWVFNAPGATIKTPEAVAAATQVVDWNKAGYFPPSVNALDATAADALFASNKGLFFPWGNWDAANLDKTMPGQVGFFPMPPVAAGGQVAAMSDAATAFGIPSKSRNKDAAAAFLNFLSSDEARQIAIDNGFMPSGLAEQAPPKIKEGSVLADVTKAFTDVSAANGQVPFVQNATAGISNRAWTPESQLLLGGSSTPETFVANVQAKYEEELKR